MSKVDQDYLGVMGAEGVALAVFLAYSSSFISSGISSRIGGVGDLGDLPLLQYF